MCRHPPKLKKEKNMLITQLQHISRLQRAQTNVEPSDINAKKGLHRTQNIGESGSFIAEQGLQKAQDNGSAVKSTTVEGLRKKQLVEAQKSKDTLSYRAEAEHTKGVDYFTNEELHPETQKNSIVVNSQNNSKLNLNNSNLNTKTAKVNFRGLSNSTAKVAKALPETKAWKIAQHRFTQWFVKKADFNQAVFEALNALFITCGLRPLAIMAQTNDKNKEKNKKAASHSIASGIIGYGFAVAIFSPIADGLSKIKKNPEIFAKKAATFFQKNGSKEVSMSASKRFQTFTMICTYGPQLFTAAARSAITIAMIPVIDKYLLNPIFGTSKKPEDKKPTIDPMYNYYYLNFSSNPKAKKAFQSFSGENK